MNGPTKWTLVQQKLKKNNKTNKNKCDDQILKLKYNKLYKILE